MFNRIISFSKATCSIAYVSLPEWNSKSAWKYAQFSLRKKGKDCLNDLRFAGGDMLILGSVSLDPVHQKICPVKTLNNMNKSDQSWLAFWKEWLPQLLVIVYSTISHDIQESVHQISYVYSQVHASTNYLSQTHRLHVQPNNFWLYQCRHQSPGRRRIAANPNALRGLA